MFGFFICIFIFGMADLVHQGSKEVNTNMECEKDINTRISIFCYGNYSRQSFNII